jgi:hypothetical protein
MRPAPIWSSESRGKTEKKIDPARGIASTSSSLQLFLSHFAVLQTWKGSDVLCKGDRQAAKLALDELYQLKG